jgi:hypothetical protein
VGGLRLHVRSLKGSKKEVGGVQSGSNHLVNNPDRVFGTDRVPKTRSGRIDQVSCSRGRNQIGGCRTLRRP